MTRTSCILLLALGLVFAADVPGFAQTTVTQSHTRKAVKSKKAAVPATAPSIGGINTPSTDFSKVERADEEPRGPNGPTFRPTMGSGGMGLGGAF